MTWEFGENDPETVAKWSEATIRDAEKQLTLAPLMTSMTEGAIRNPEAKNLEGIIRVHTEFAGRDKKGKTVTIHNVADIDAAEQGVMGDGLLRDTGADLDTHTMTLRYDAVAFQVRSSGELNEKATVLDFRKTSKDKLARVARFKQEGAMSLLLNGLTQYDNATVLKHWPQNGVVSSVYGNTIQAFDSAHILYAGDATSNSDIGEDDVLTAQFLSKVQTYATEDLDIPLDPLMVDGQPELIVLASGRACEQILYDEDFVRANADANTRGAENPIVKRSIGKWGMFRIIPWAFALNPAANVGQTLVLGKDALQILKVEDFSWFEDFEDNRKRRKVISIGGQFGGGATYFNGTRRNALALRHYIRA